MPSTLRSGASKQALEFFGLELKQAREAKGITQQSVAEELKVSTQSVSNWETGTYEPKARHLERMAGLYGVDGDELRRSVLAKVADGRSSLDVSGCPEKPKMISFELELPYQPGMEDFPDVISVSGEIAEIVMNAIKLSQNPTRRGSKKRPMFRS